MIPEHIETIRLEGMLPLVFTNESIPASDVWHAHLSFQRGKSYLIEATSGAGKSSMCAFIFGARTDYEGTLMLGDMDARRLSIPDWQQLRRRNIAYLPQELALFPELTAMENVRLKNDLTGHLSETRIAELFDRLGISQRSDRPAGRLSIGQQQRVALIRSIAQPFDFILLDEPVSHLDHTNNSIVAEIISEEARRQGAAIIATSVGNHLDLNYDLIYHL